MINGPWWRNFILSVCFFLSIYFFLIISLLLIQKKRKNKIPIHHHNMVRFVLSICRFFQTNDKLMLEQNNKMIKNQSIDFIRPIETCELAKLFITILNIVIFPVFFPSKLMMMMWMSSIANLRQNRQQNF